MYVWISIAPVVNEAMLTVPLHTRLNVRIVAELLNWVLMSPPQKQQTHILLRPLLSVINEGGED